MSAFSAIGEETEQDQNEFTPGLEPQPTWCPGCGDFGVLKALKGAAAELGLSPDEMMVTTGIGCSGKLNSYFNSYGFHTIHGRSLPIARAAKLANPGLTVVAAGGDGDGYGIGGNHFMHTARENHDITYIVFNNEIFGLTKGQTSPTSPMGHKSKTQPHGSAKTPLRPLSMSLNAGASYVARTAAVNPNQAKDIIVEAIQHDGFSHVDFLTQCPTWNKDARQYVPYIDINDSDDYEFDNTNRSEASEMMFETENALHEGTVLTGRYYVDEDRPSYQQEKQRIGEMPEEPLAERYFDDSYEWERTFDNFLDKHK
ncbi:MULTISPECIES: thiamine pyrophosphate-dependent enzyme [Haloferax]|jgi:pyruvate ferredoxin oxidoreductase beta subunit|uniref:Pyruvate--ferredoxin oxidoreductase beta subunit n=10 Tax=Haloferax TaxID=2251 RepID=D4GXE9_HALVD|nr:MULTISPECIES: thiamine pyrophosphate-dependent enzyme [Haloferax]ADE03292.1 pyruvate--ferredoxin oxidoreductase beta subunit [Haloferax volcanii DS2]ELK49297.1 pyruvate ferredoxin/flavodoxin oxidoreductase subunit beta [Haloferax sp. BAB-2207]ELY28008.1 pyruvate ferredoxin/flavodoxin oxidoreductase subunit beta [Haloferax volcanii DS2]ELZ60163.1 pyruvate ferredoxin/flavodoxin oxidoreductase subunit beta [Haloferax sp. ATCC BAA-646]ELZ64375.1 pyruvate ferredoxin/flavodoxin oxidoreductase sub